MDSYLLLRPVSSLRGNTLSGKDVDNRTRSRAGDKCSAATSQPEEYMLFWCHYAKTARIEIIGEK